MTKPILLVIAGCNGSGKSTFSKDIGAGNFEPFDYDLHFLRNYSTLLDIDIKDKMAHNITWQQLENQVEEAIKRVAIRVQNGGHFVPETEIKKRYFEGFTNLNTCYPFFDSIDLFDTSSYGEEPKFILSIEKDKPPFISSIPSYLKELIPVTFYS